MSAQKPRSITGIKPTGNPHLGNYLGAIQPALDLTHSHDSFVFIADLHALTSTPKPQLLEEQTYSVAATWLALGLDPNKTVLYKQSDVPEIPTLAWLLSCVLPVGMLWRSHSYKAARDRGDQDTINHGVFAYPALMAADILICQADIVPVGKDQKQHIEVAIEAARKFNNLYGEVFTIPKAKVNEQTQLVPGIDGQKMSKSYDNTLEIFGSEKQISNQIKKIVTDSRPLGSPLGQDNIVLTLSKLLDRPANKDMLSRMYETGRLLPELGDFPQNYFGWGHAKTNLIGLFVGKFAVARERYLNLMQDKAYLRQVLRDGAYKVREISVPLLEKAQRATGLAV